MTPLLRGAALRRSFGDSTAVDDVTIEVDRGEVVGLLGANGAGKTTLLRMLLGLLPPTSGSVSFLGGPPARATRREVGYVPQQLGLYGDLTVAANRRFHREVFSTGRGTTAADSVDHLPGVDDDVVVEDLPLGTQRRLAFEIAVAHDPALLVLDEPTSGVGPLGRARLWESIGDAADAGRGVLVTTHHMAEAEQCGRLVVMAAGRVVATGTARDIVGDAHAVLVTGAPPGPVLVALEQAGLLGALAPGGIAVPDGDRSEVEAVLADAGVVADVVVRASTLEERFAVLATAATADRQARP